VPIVNVFGFVNESRYLPDRRDLNRSFPGSPRGSLTGQLAHLFMTQVVRRCQYGIDFHTGSDHRTNQPQLRVDLSDPEVERLAKAFAAPVTVDAAFRDGSLRSACRAIGIPLLVFEGGEAHRFNAGAIGMGVEGSLRVMAELGMIAGPEVPPMGETMIVRHSHWERARRSGIVRIDVFPGQAVERGEVLGIIGDALGTRHAAVRASRTGVVLGYTRNPLVSQGDALVHIADLSESARGGPARSPS
jgi:predicted deacylase